ncbi:hypothetical protein HDU98_007729 [Podochytrium sp. JEL0797]|nr:hypothetical protein HDU98_007729 [Podochytrium sp. JEL0797]
MDLVKSDLPLFIKQTKAHPTRESLLSLCELNCSSPAGSLLVQHNVAPFLARLISERPEFADLCLIGLLNLVKHCEEEIPINLPSLFDAVFPSHSHAPFDIPASNDPPSVALVELFLLLSVNACFKSKGAKLPPRNIESLFDFAERYDSHVVKLDWVSLPFYTLPRDVGVQNARGEIPLRKLLFCFLQLVMPRLENDLHSMIGLEVATRCLKAACVELKNTPMNPENEAYLTIVLKLFEGVEAAKPIYFDMQPDLMDTLVGLLQYGLASAHGDRVAVASVMVMGFLMLIESGCADENAVLALRALQSGLLPVLFKHCADLEKPEHEFTYSYDIGACAIGTVLHGLRSCLVYKGVLKEMKENQHESVRWLEDFLAGSAFSRKSKIGKTLQALLSDLEILMEPEEHVCGSCRCCSVNFGVAFKKCAACMTYYCSKECQVKDWKVGTHKKDCANSFKPQLAMTSVGKARFKLLKRTVERNWGALRKQFKRNKMEADDVCVWVDLGREFATVELIRFAELKARAVRIDESRPQVPEGMTMCSHPLTLLERVNGPESLVAIARSTGTLVAVGKNEDVVDLRMMGVSVKKAFA